MPYLFQALDASEISNVTGTIGTDGSRWVPKVHPAKTELSGKASLFSRNPSQSHKILESPSFRSSAVQPGSDYGIKTAAEKLV